MKEAIDRLDSAPLLRDSIHDEIKQSFQKFGGDKKKLRRALADLVMQYSKKL